MTFQTLASTETRHAYSTTKLDEKPAEIGSEGFAASRDHDVSVVAGALERILSEARDRRFIRPEADLGILRGMIMGALLSWLLLESKPFETEMQEYLRRLLREIGLPDQDGYGGERP